MSNDPKQLIIVRNDLRSKLRHGKLAAQVAHASMAAFLVNAVCETFDDGGAQFVHSDLDDPGYDWFMGSFTKIVLRADNLEHLLELNQAVRDADIVHSALITDSGRTVFGEPTVTCLGVGPELPSVLDPIFGNLSMY